MTSTKIVSVLVTCGALLAFGGVASAQSVQRETVTERGGPSHSMLFSGVGTFGISYGAARSSSLRRVIWTPTTACTCRSPGLGWRCRAVVRAASVPHAPATQPPRIRY